jgi:hypothetical protein
VHKRNTLFDVSLEPLDARLEERLLLVGDVLEDVDGLLRTVGLCTWLARLAWPSPATQLVDLLQAR